ncbi:unnamed protein product [Choristocarpus tenellus]
MNKNLSFSKSFESMHKFAEIYAKQTNTFFCIDPSITSVVINGLANYKEKYGAPLCPCRNYDNINGEIKLSYWNCPCVPMRERKECHCKLFLTSDDDYASQLQTIDIKEFF